GVAEGSGSPAPQDIVARPARFERATFGFGGQRSIHRAKGAGASIDTPARRVHAWLSAARCNPLYLRVFPAGRKRHGYHFTSCTLVEDCMSESPTEDHSTPIKTPGQLITVVVLSFLVPISTIVLIVQMITGGLHIDK